MYYSITGGKLPWQRHDTNAAVFYRWDMCLIRVLRGSVQQFISLELLKLLNGVVK